MDRNSPAWDEDVRPRPGHCLIYSVGVGGELSWDYAMKNFNCSVLAFDMTMVNWTNIQLGTGLHFLDLGLADFDSDNTINMTARGRARPEMGGAGGSLPYTGHHTGGAGPHATPPRRSQAGH
ncbi:uncharacterized protein LOC135099552 [Scylla paramamosain]|uniref:uncharacterized protein LOC135099552 n=1 Tax=Scylla paramamosain TaxID=85552 RepID=UPI003083D391